MQKITSQVYVESGFPGVTVGVIVTKQGLICVDTPTHPGDAQKWRLKLDQQFKRPILYVINTDHHRDRILSNQWFGEEGRPAPVIAHIFTGDRLRLYPEVLKGGVPEAGLDFEMAKEYAGVRIIPPQIMFSEEMTVFKGEVEIILRHMPGSAPGAIWVLAPSAKVVFTGDSVVMDTHPFLAEADFERWNENLIELRKARFPAKTIVPGRGKATDKDHVKWTQDYLRYAERKLQAMMGRRPKTDVFAVVAELLRRYPVPEAEREAMRRRLRLELERHYDLREGDGANV
jgi:glyoxylase-like metal-dependent hydrolase (beta-lactamase superfamily II)